jgi:hypothetical protein
MNFSKSLEDLNILLDIMLENPASLDDIKKKIEPVLYARADSIAGKEVGLIMVYFPEKKLPTIINQLRIQLTIEEVSVRQAVALAKEFAILALQELNSHYKVIRLVPNVEFPVEYELPAKEGP